MSFAGSSLDAALARLSVAMGVNNAIGESAQAAMDAAARVVWRPIRLKYQRPHEQPPDGKACSEVWVVCEVEVRGADWSGFESIANKLEVALYEEFSENSYERQSDVELGGDDVDSSGFGGLGQIALVFPVYASRFGVANITETAQTAVVKGPMGNEDTI